MDGALEINYSSESIKLFKREDIDHDDLDYHLADIAEVGIGKCLKQWNKGIANLSSDNRVCYLVQTEGYQYVYQVQDGNIYCGCKRI